VSDTSTATAAPEKAKSNRDRLIYPTQQVGNGIMQAFFSTYLSNLMTAVYVFPVTVAGVVESLSQAIGWITGPVSGALIDRITFKKAKYWPWIVIGSIGGAICYIIVFSLPVFVADPTKLVIPVAIIILLQRILAGPGTAVGNTLYAQLARDGKLRAYLAMWGKVGRDGMKVVVGFIFPLMLASFIASGMPEVNAWALIAVILAGASIVLQAVTVYLTKNSQLEKDAVAGKGMARRKSIPLTKTVATIFTNRALLSAFLCQTLSKVFYFYHVMGGMYLWRYYMENMTMMSIYMTLLSLAAIVGAMLVPVVFKIFKDTKICAAMTYIAQAIIYAISYFVLSQSNPVGSIVVICCASFFNGMSDSFLQPLFAHGADYSAWKTGSKDYGLNMAVFALSVTTGSLLSTITRTAALARGGFDSRALASGAAVPATVKAAIHNLNTLYPLILCVVIALILFFVYPLNDKKVAEIQKEMAEREAAKS